MSIVVKFKKIRTNAYMPVKGTPYAAGWDLYASLGKDDVAYPEDYQILINQGHRALIGTGICLEIPEGYEGQIRPRSGLANDKGTFACFGTIDSDYRGEIMVNLFNNSMKQVWIANYQKIAQIVFQPVLQVQFEATENLSDTLRGTQGFGSTGK